uniref:Uncharacterized protein n=1 Tax=Vibrio phage P018-4 TaxID=3229728 RepID=A0AB39AJR0_9CAUD
MTMQLNTVKQRFYDRQWNSEDNKNLLNIISKSRLNIEPACLYGLDQLGMNHLEIINVSSCIGKRFIGIPQADIDNLNMLQEKYGCVFNFEQKQRYYDKKVKTHPMQTKLDSYVSQPSGDYWLKSSALLQLSENYI